MVLGATGGHDLAPPHPRHATLALGARPVKIAGSTGRLENDRWIFLCLTVPLSNLISCQCCGSGSIFDESGSSWRKKRIRILMKYYTYLTKNETNFIFILYLVGPVLKNYFRKTAILILIFKKLAAQSTNLLGGHRKRQCRRCKTCNTRPPYWWRPGPPWSWPTSEWWPDLNEKQ